MPKDVRPSRPESVKRTSSDMMLQYEPRRLVESTIGRLRVSDFVPPMQQTRSSSSFAQSLQLVLSFTVYVQFVYTSRTGYATPIHAIPSSMHLPVVRRSTQAARLIISSLIGSPIPVKILVETGGTIEQNGRYFSSSFRRGRRPRDHLCPLWDLFDPMALPSYNSPPLCVAPWSRDG
jgi:hypothetical protein